MGSFYVECIDCGEQTTYSPSSKTCPRCKSEWLQAQYDFENLAHRLPELLAGRPFDLWRYRELLPIFDHNLELSMGEGGTPLIRAAALGMMLGLPNIYIKDERQGPTASFKDRQAALGVAALKEAGITEMVLASTGNVAISYSAYAARAGIKLWAFLTSLVPAEKMREVAIYGTQVIKVAGSYDQTKQVAAEFARQRGLYLERGSRSIPSVEGMKTIAYESTEQLAWLRATESASGKAPPGGAKRTPLQAPDWYFQAVSGGVGPLGVLKGFTELYRMGLTGRIPAIAGIQTEGCAPMVHAWKQGLDVAEPVQSPRTHIATLSTGDPGRTYSLVRKGMQVSGGCFESVTDEETFRTLHILAELEGVSVEPAAAVAFAGLIKLARLGKISPDEVIVVNCSGHTIPVERIILGERWALHSNGVRNCGGRLRAPLPHQAPIPEEGLLAALDHVTADRYPRIAIVDDNEDARRLIRRILQAQGNYSLFEAASGRQAIELARKELPDLIILDLMMPEIDGFAVLDALKANPKTAPIPVIIVTAKELSSAEKNRLKGQIHSLMQKGEFMNDELMDEVRALVK